MNAKLCFSLMASAMFLGCGGEVVSEGTNAPANGAPPSASAPTNACAPSTADVKSWTLEGSAAQKYQLGPDSSVTCSASTSLTLQSTTTTTAEDFGTGMTQVKGGSLPATFIGQRVRLSGFVKTERVTGAAGLWMRVDGADLKVLGFDNMHARPIVGTTDWTPYQVVLDVPADAVTVSYGFLLNDGGQIWLDGVTVDVVDASVPTTG